MESPSTRSPIRRPTLDPLRIALLSWVLGACGGPPRPVEPPRADERPAETIVRERPVAARHDDRVAELRAALGAIVAERDPVGGDRVHLVLHAGRCYRLGVVASSAIAVAVRDEHDHVVAEGTGDRIDLAPICPRWTGSFELALTWRGERGRASLLVAASESAQPSASRTSPSSTASSTR
ncbi:MAG: hypothetical protein AB7S26_28395 [Sandaracinaceae bacterium]